MRALLLRGLLPLLLLLCLLHPAARGHSLGRPNTDLEQLKSVLQRLEVSLSEASEDEQEPGDYGPEPGSQRGAGPHTGGAESDEPGLRGLLDLLQASRRSSGCFGARMDRIGNASGLGCGRG